ncbi:MAG: hypothetical protein KGI91_16315 [Burkholderiales bacterium]|nr:hypothetical protein [Burkholderiales bacterium]
MSKGQLQEAFRQTAEWISTNDWRGAWAVCSALSTLTVDLLPNLPLADSKADAWIACIDVEAGVIKLDVGFLAEDSAAAPVNATAVAASLINTKPLPAALVYQLRERLKATPDAKTLGELYPEAPPLSGDQAMICLPCEITPSWSRWINSVGIYARSIGIDNLLAALITGDFGHIPRSKIHYAVAGKDEIWSACDRLFQQIGWGNAARDSGQIVGFGSRIVSKADALQRAVAFLYSKSESVRPARRDRDLARLLEFHNRYTKYVACELALLLALRQTKAYPLFADIDECADLWVDVEDKKIPGPPGSLPVALCTRAKKLIGCFRIHCFAVAGRIENLGGTGTVFHEWLLAVVNGEPVGLLCTASSLARIQRVGSHAVFGSLDPDIAIAHDAGRKWLENTLRYQGLRTGDIDAMLRHHIVGQSRSCSTSDFILVEWCQRVSKAIDAVANQLFGKVNSGLARRH